MRIVFMGSPEFAVAALRAVAAVHEVVLVVTQPDKPAGRGKRVAAPAVKVCAEELGLAVLQPQSAKTAAFAEAMRATGAELAVVVAYGKILPAAVLEAFPRGCLNIHGSLLPAYRGAAPIQWAVINDEPETGVSIMQLDEGMDTGPVYATRAIPIGPATTSGELFTTLAAAGADLLLTVLDGMEKGQLHARAQDHTAATHARMLTKEDGIIDWNHPARRVSAQVRGVDPWPGAVTSLGGEPFKLFGARVVDGVGAPGEVLLANADGLVVACAEGAIRIAEVQAAGKRRLPVAAYLSGHPLAAGTRLGAP